jgi:hypothetical protein
VQESNTGQNVRYTYFYSVCDCLNKFTVLASCAAGRHDPKTRYGVCGIITAVVRILSLTVLLVHGLTDPFPLSRFVSPLVSSHYGKVPFLEVYFEAKLKYCCSIDVEERCARCGVRL